MVGLCVCSIGVFNGYLDDVNILFFSGVLDSETKELMSLPRCGVRDKVGFGENRSKRYALQGIYIL